MPLAQSPVGLMGLHSLESRVSACWYLPQVVLLYTDCTERGGRVNPLYIPRSPGFLPGLYCEWGWSGGHGKTKETGSFCFLSQTLILEPSHEVVRKSKQPVERSSSVG